MNTPKGSLLGKIVSALSLVVVIAITLTACAPQQTASQQSTAAAAGAQGIDTTKLHDVLLYHIVNQVVMSPQLASLNWVITRQGGAIGITSPNAAVVLNTKVNVVEPEIPACNGVIHVVDQMLALPAPSTAATPEAAIAATGATATPEPTAAPCQTIAAILRGQARFSGFAGALESVGLMEMLDKDGTYTVFAPPNGVFVAPKTVETTGGGTATSGDANSADANSAGGKITICHHTGSATNPYVEITVSKNALNGHDKHAGDVIPAPAGGCPAK